MTQEPCPFCGETMFSHWRKNPKDSLERLTGPVCICGAAGGMYATEEEALAAWNTRKPPKVR